jgi:hypothetical protein
MTSCYKNQATPSGWNGRPADKPESVSVLALVEVIDLLEKENARVWRVVADLRRRMHAANKAINGE